MVQPGGSDMSFQFFGLIAHILTNHEELFIESSSGIVKEAVQHSLDDTIKLIIECTNSLGQSIRHHKNASMTTMCEKEVYAIQVIVNKLTLFEVSLKPELKWKVMEVRSSTLPVTWETRFCFLELFELMATLILGQEKQSKVHEKLLMESTGYTKFTSPTVSSSLKSRGVKA